MKFCAFICICTCVQFASEENKSALYVCEYLLNFLFSNMTKNKFASDLNRSRPSVNLTAKNLCRLGYVARVDETEPDLGRHDPDIYTQQYGFEVKEDKLSEKPAYASPIIKGKHCIFFERAALTDGSRDGSDFVVYYDWSPDSQGVHVLHIKTLLKELPDLSGTWKCGNAGDARYRRGDSNPGWVVPIALLDGLRGNVTHALVDAEWVSSWTELKSELKQKDAARRRREHKELAPLRSAYARMRS